MIRFVDLKTGNVFNGESNNREHPYIFWFDGEQSINMIYTQPICFICDEEEKDISINPNSLFKLIDTSKITGENYQDITTLYSENNYLKSIGIKHHNYYVHVIYISISTEVPGEYIEDFNIDGSVYKVGGDFYGAEESLYINLSNMGVDIPESVQKALYSIDIHEDKRDNILLNRKWKEMLSNYWDMIACKGSYKSLYNSLKWFEYGDILKLSEIWKYPQGSSGIYLMKEIQEIMNDKYVETMKDFSKTTYLSITCALQEYEKDKYGNILRDTEDNPILKNKVFDWSVQDISLKLSMLGSFYKTYFLPIHLDLIHSTIESIVYTNTIKNITGTLFNRKDYIYNCEELECNIKDGSIFNIGLVESYVGPNTIFGPLGVDKEIPQISSNDDLKKYLDNLYKNHGVIVEFELKCKLEPEDKITQEYITFLNPTETQKHLFENVFGEDIKFNLLCKEVGDYYIGFQFISKMGRIFTKLIKFSVIDIDGIKLNLYKIQNIPLDERKNINLSLGGGEPHKLNKYHLSKNNIKQYIPSSITKEQDEAWGYRGVCLNHLLICTEQNTSLQNDYYELVRSVGEKDEATNEYEKKYYIYISKKFGHEPIGNINNIYREDYIFVPEFHRLVEFGGDTLEDYTIDKQTALCVIPEFKFTDNIISYEWKFKNVTTNEEIIYKDSIQEPFIADSKKEFLKPGYYDIEFSYEYPQGKINTTVLHSAFIMK